MDNKKRSRYRNRSEQENYSVFLKHMADDKKESSKFARALVFIVIVVFALAVFCMFFLRDEQSIEGIFGKDTFISNKLIEFIHRHRSKACFGFPFMGKSQNVLLLGVDASNNPDDPWTATRSDTIVLMNIDPRTRSVNAISIPRDSKVYLSGGFGVQKINAAHALGGIDATKRTVEETLGVKVDKYIMVSDDAVKKLVDALGGVPIYVEKRMNYDDYSGHLHVHLNKGDNVLDGSNAVGYLRFRHDGLGDIGRTQRQQWFMRGLLEKIQTPAAIAKIPEMVNIAKTYVKTDLSLYEMTQYAAMSKSFDISKIEVATLPGSPNKRGSTSYWILDPEKTQEVVNRLIYRDEPTITNEKFTAGIVYSAGRESEAQELKAQLKALGYDATTSQRSHLPHSQFIANSSTVSNEYFNWLKKKVPSIKDDQFVYDPNKFYCVDCDFVVIMSGR